MVWETFLNPEEHVILQFNSQNMKKIPTNAEKMLIFFSFFTNLDDTIKTVLWLDNRKGPTGFVAPGITRLKKVNTVGAAAVPPSDSCCCSCWFVLTAEDPGDLMQGGPERRDHSIEFPPNTNQDH